MDKRRERGLIYRREWILMEGALMALLRMLHVGVEVGGEMVIEVEIREDVRFAEGAGVRATDRFAGWSDFCILLCASSRYFLSITYPLMMSLTSSGGTTCPLRRSQSCFALIKTELRM